MDDGPDSLTRYDTAAHLVAGGTVAALIDRGGIRLGWPWYARYPVAIATAWSLGWSKEHLIDRNPSAKDQNAWALGAVVALTWRWDL